MTFLSSDQKPSLIQLLILTLFIIIGMLYFGLRPKGSVEENNLSWSNPPPGIAFNRFAMAFTEKFSSHELFSEERDELTIEFAIQPKFDKKSGFMHLLLIHGRDDQQLVVGQWRTSLVIMNGTDYSNKLRTPKIYAQLEEEGIPQFLTIVSDESGTQYYLNSKLNKKSSRLKLRYPDQHDQGRILIANSLSGKNPWVGTILGLNLYDRALDLKTIHHHYSHWRRENNFNAFRNDAPKVSYTFDEGMGQIVHNKVGFGPNLNLPSQMKVLQKNVLAWPSLTDLYKRGMLIDLLINFFGFFPLGFILFATLEKIKGTKEGIILLTAILISTILSLSIEILQIWLPFRDSSSLDLVLNITGSALGAASYKILIRL